MLYRIFRFVLQNILFWAVDTKAKSKYEYKWNDFSFCKTVNTKNVSSQCIFNFKMEICESISTEKTNWKIIAAILVLISLDYFLEYFFCHGTVSLMVFFIIHPITTISKNFLIKKLFFTWNSKIAWLLQIIVFLSFDIAHR